MFSTGTQEQRVSSSRAQIWLCPKYENPSAASDTRHTDSAYLFTQLHRKIYNIPVSSSASNIFKYYEVWET